MNYSGFPTNIDQETAVLYVHKLLDGCYWLPTLDPSTAYERSTDDHDGEWQPRIQVMVDDQGDVWVSTHGTKYGHPSFLSFRFRTYQGGGSSLRVRNAMLILAEAIRLDNLDNPEPNQTC